MITITEDDLKKFAPNARSDYVSALLGNIYLLRTTGVLDNSYRVCHFMAQVGHETNGLTILRESLTYKTAKRLREVWPARFRDKTDAELKPLLKDPRRLGDAVYLGRMGNTQAGDGHDYRGGGYLQTTGRGPVTKYCERLGLDPSPSLLDDPSVTLQFACIEWADSRCNEHADENDLTKVSKAINTGSAAGNVKPVGMDSRQEWFAKAWAIWGDRGKADTKPKAPMTVKAMIGKVFMPAAAAGETARQMTPPDLSLLSAWKATADTAVGLSSWAWGNWKLTLAALAAYGLIGHVLPWWSKRNG